MVREFARYGVAVQGATIAHDLGLDQSCGRSGAQPKAAARMTNSIRRQQRTRAWGLSGTTAGRLYRAGAWASEAYHLRSVGASRSKLQALRRDRARVTVQLRPHMRLTSCFAVTGPQQDPAVEVPLLQIKDCWAFGRDARQSRMSFDLCGRRP